MKNKKIVLHAALGFFLFSSWCSAKIDITFDQELSKEVPLTPAPPIPQAVPTQVAPVKPQQPKIPQPSDFKSPLQQAFTEQPREQRPSPQEQEIAMVANETVSPQEEIIAPSEEQPLAKIESKKKSKKEPRIAFDFKDEKLVNVINLFASKKGINIVLPQGNDAIKTTVTLNQRKKIPLSQAENYVYLFLELAGYVMYPTNGFFVIAKKSEPTEGREPLDLYISIPPSELPQNSEFIRAIYYLTNLQVPANNQGTDPLSAILNDLVGRKRFMYDQKSNAIILSGPSDNIATAMNIILELDATGSPEVVEMFPLFNANAEVVAKLIQDQITVTAKKPQGGGRVQIKGETGFYFTPNTRALADPRTNSLILIGTEAAITRIKDFTREYLDVEQNTGRSILHVYDLQYLDAEKFAPVLQNIVNGNASRQSEKDAIAGGPHRFFEQVIITAEIEKTAEAEKIAGQEAKGSTTAKGVVKLGGNRLIVTAKQDDWNVIKALIEELDKPELQVIIEVMILDITLQGDKAIGTQMRNPFGIGLPENLQLQSAQLTNPILGPTNTDQQTLAADLLRLLIPTTSANPTQSAAVPLTSGSNVGSMLISFKDPCQDAIWAMMRILDRWTTKNIISHPFIVTKNNVKATQTLRDIRQAPGRDVASGGVVTIKIEDFIALVAVEVTPRVSSLDRLNLQIRVDVQDFIQALTGAATAGDFTVTKRSVETNATMNTGQVLVLGGLTKETDTEFESKWPILGDIPIFGQFFKNTVKGKVKNNLVILVHPTIVHPKLRSGENKYTEDRIENERIRLGSEGLFAGTKAPVTRLFFTSMGTKDSVGVLNDYLDGANYQKGFDESLNIPINLEELNPARIPTEPDAMDAAYL